jgi:hypothetical protein
MKLFKNINPFHNNSSVQIKYIIANIEDIYKTQN